MTVKGKISAVYFLLAGISIPAVWAVMFSTGRTAGIMNTPVSGTFHIISDALLTASCIAVSAGMVKGTGWPRRFLFATCGLIISSAISSGSYFLFNSGNQDYPLAWLFILLLILALAVFIPHYRDSIHETRGAGGMFLMTGGLLVYLLINLAGYFGQKCLDESGVYAGAFFLLMIGALLLGRFTVYAIIRESPFIIARG